MVSGHGLADSGSAGSALGVVLFVRYPVHPFLRCCRFSSFLSSLPQHGYAVLFLFREGSLLPFLAALQERASSAFDRGSGGAAQLSAATEALAAAARADSPSGKASADRLLRVPFATVFEYLQYLRCAAECARGLGEGALFYLAAAVSDYYVPYARMAEHKISKAGPLTLTLDPVPKALGDLRRRWAPDAVLVSFKLETDIAVLFEKAYRAVENYGVDAVVANELHSRKEKVWIVRRKNDDQDDALDLPLDARAPHGAEARLVQIAGKDDVIENGLVAAIVRIHDDALRASAPKAP